MSDNVVGKSKAAANPHSTRATARNSGLGAQAAIIEVGIVRIAPATKSNLRPYRSPIAPRYSTLAASPRAKPSPIWVS